MAQKKYRYESSREARDLSKNGLFTPLPINGKSYARPVCVSYILENKNIILSKLIFCSFAYLYVGSNLSGPNLRPATNPNVSDRIVPQRPIYHIIIPATTVLFPHQATTRTLHSGLWGTCHHITYARLDSRKLAIKGAMVPLQLAW